MNERRSVEMVEVMAMESAPKGNDAGSDAASLPRLIPSEPLITLLVDVIL